LVGSVIGAELGFARVARPDNPPLERAGDVFAMELEPILKPQEQPGRIGWRALTPFIGLGVRAFVAKNGRVTPEDFADLLRSDPQVSGPVHTWDGLHSTQEVLREGMHPRLSGLGIAPCGSIAASMPAVGIYHFADPEYAYLDGVELASVAQPRLGADWAGLCAAAIACAFDPGSTPEGIVDTVLKIAHQNNKDLFYATNLPMREMGRFSPGSAEEPFVEWWCRVGGRTSVAREMGWIAYNPVSFVLPLLGRYAQDAPKLMALLLAPRNSATSVAPIIAGAILGASHGVDAFPQEWRQWAEPIARPWLPIVKVVQKRLDTERTVVSTVERLSEKQEGGSSLLFDKIHGCILAGAIGNAMGSPVEGAFYWEVDGKHPGGVTTVLDPSRLEGEDDNQMAMLLAETYLDRAGLPVMARHFGRTWQERLNRDHFYPLCMGNAYDLIRQGWDPRITGHWSVVTGSTVMCMEPVGIYHLADPEYASMDATAISYMYQRGLDVTAAAILAATVAEAFRPQATVESVCRAALAAAPTTPMDTFDQRAFESPYDYIAKCLEIADRFTDVLAARAELYEKCLFYHMIDPLELLGFALAMFKIAQGDVRQAAIGGTNIGRDSDTIAGRAAMLSGVLKGAGSVPREWIALFKPESLERIRRNAARLTDLIVEQKTERLRRRQSIS
jgi:ADP-ribosylglycohydrolase